MVRRVSVSSDGSEANSGSFAPAISGDGRTVAFVSTATNLVKSDRDAGPDVFVHDVKSGVTTRVSVHRRSSPSLSFDGRFVAFASSPEDLVAPPRQERSLFTTGRQARLDRPTSMTQAASHPAVERTPRLPPTVDSSRSRRSRH